MNYNPAFAKTMERLLSGEVICEIAYREGFDLLNDPRQFTLINDTLTHMGRRLAKTEDGVGYYAVYRDLNDPGLRRSIQNRFARIAGDWEPLCHWLKLTRKISHDRYPIHAGDMLSLSNLLASVEDSVSSQKDVEKIARRFKVSTRKDTKSQLEGILKHLEDEGYLVPYGASGASYKATSRWSLLMEMMAYIQRQEGILAEEVADDEMTEEPQGGLF